MLLTKDAILAIDDRQFEEVEVPEWGGSVRMRGMSGRERDAYEASIIDQRGGERKVVLANARAKLIAKCVVDEGGNLMFTVDDLRALGGKSAKALERLFDKARELSGMAEGDVERLAENFEDDPSGDATSE